MDILKINVKILNIKEEELELKPPWSLCSSPLILVLSKSFPVTESFTYEGRAQKSTCSHTDAFLILSI